MKLFHKNKLVEVKEDEIDVLNPHLLDWRDSGSSIQLANERLIPGFPMISGSSYDPYPVFYATDHTNDVKLPFGGTVSDELVDKLWEKMYQQPVLVRCPHCDSANVVTNPTCIQCGAPLGKAKKVEHK